MKILPVAFQPSRFGTLLFLLFCGCMDVLAMAPETYHHLPTDVRTEWITDSDDYSVIAQQEQLSTASNAFSYSPVRSLPNSFSATLRWYADRISRLHVQQWEQFLHHKLSHLRQIAFQQAHRIDLFEGSVPLS